MTDPIPPSKNIIGLDEHKAKARGSTGRSRVSLWSGNGAAELVIEHVTGEEAAMISLGQSAGSFDRLALAGLLDRVLSVLAPELSEPNYADAEDDDG